MSGWRAAIVAALVGGAILVAGALLDDRPSTTDASGQASSGTQDDEETAGSGSTLACSSSIVEACRAAAPVLGVNAVVWSLGDPAPDRGAIVAPASDLEASGISADGAPVVASSPIVVAAWRDRAQVLGAACGSVDAACVAGAIGEQWSALGGPTSWGRFKLGLAEPSGSEAGMLAWSLLSDAATDTQLSSLGSALRIRASDSAALVGELVAFGDSRADVVVTEEAIVVAQFDNAIDRGGRFEITYPSEGPWVEYVVVGQGFGSGGLIEELQTQAVAEAFTANGLRSVLDSAGAVGEPMGEPGTMTPAPDATSRGTLITRWNEYS